MNKSTVVERPRSPYDEASIFGILTFSFLNPLIKLGSRRPLEYEDIYNLPSKLYSDVIYSRIKTSWNEERKIYGPKAYFGRALARAFWRLFLIGNLVFIIFIVVLVIQPYFVRELLNFVGGGNADLVGIKSGVAIAILLGVISAIGTFSMNSGFYLATRTSIYFRSSTVLLVFDKSLLLSSASKSKHTTGEIVTLMSVDSERLVQGIMIIQWLWMGPVLIIISMCLLIQEVNYSALAGAGSMILITWLQSEISKRVGGTRRELLKFTDERVKLMNETLQGIRVVKLYAWEKPTRDRIEEIRADEVAKVRKFQMLKLVNTVSMFLAPLLVAFAVFISYASTGGELTVEKVYTIYAILNIIRLPVTIIPMAMAAGQEMMVCLNRITKFLLLEEIQDVQSLETSAEGGKWEEGRTAAVIESHRLLIDVQNADFAWNGEINEANKNNTNPSQSGKTEPGAVSMEHEAGSCSGSDEPSIILQGVDFQLREGEFIAVVGSVGSGKSSLIAALLGQMHRLRGCHRLSPSLRIAYAAQEHWIQNRSLRDNITFDSEFDIDLYADVLDASELSKDILSLPHADDTEIGEKGINLSGGQKARVSIARALYTRDADLYIFDDSLAAVDAHVGRAIFENAFCGVLANKARIVVLSSNYHFLSRFDKLAVVLDGRLVAFDKYENVIEKYPQFISLDREGNSHVNLVDLEREPRGVQGSQRAQDEDSVGYDVGETVEEPTAHETSSTHTTGRGTLMSEPLCLTETLTASAPPSSMSSVAESMSDGGEGIGASSIAALEYDSDAHSTSSLEDHKFAEREGYGDVKRGQENVVNIDDIKYDEPAHVPPSQQQEQENEPEDQLQQPPKQQDEDGVLQEGIAQQLRGDDEEKAPHEEVVEQSGLSLSSLGSMKVKFPKPEKSSQDMLATSNHVDRKMIVNRSYKYRDNLAKVASIRQQSQSTKLMGAEDRETGAVTMRTYFRYLAGAVTTNLQDQSSWKGMSVLAALLIMFSCAQAIRVLADFWVGIWSQQISKGSPSHTQRFYIDGYIVIVVVCSVFGLIRSLLFVQCAIASSRNIHKSILGCVLRAPINLYFDITPIGRILNRFSKDLDLMDSMLPDTFLQNLQNSLYVISILIICIASTYYFAILLVPIAALFVSVQAFFRMSSREMKRLESISRSPMYSLFEEVLQGLSTIRAYKRQDLMLDRHFERTDANTRCYYVFWIASRWLALRLDLISSSVILAVALLAVIIVETNGSVDTNVLGLALVYAMQLTGLLQWTVRMIVETENSMTSVERLLAFTNVPNEAADDIKTDPNLNEWPSKGDLEISNLSLRYRPGLEKVLNNLYVKIPGGSKVGVCGRTGAGKSSLMLALFRLVEPEEHSIITLDGVDLLSIGLRCLRSALTIIPQDPVMFSGTLRYNLDPFNVFSDEDIWMSLERAQLKQDILDKFPDKLNHVVSERGENISIGQRQLICIARALLRRSKVIIMDEATASVDTATDEKIQKAVRTEFKSCTVLTIAHRLETIADSDMILVMDEGRIAEQGPPLELLIREYGIFTGLVDELGPERKEAFKALAAKKQEL